MPLEPDDRLLRPYHPVRYVAGGADAPWPGQLVTTDAGEHSLLVDAGVFDDCWPGWSADTDGHLLAPLDLVRRSSGHDVAFPACAGTVEEFLRRRLDGRVPLSAGEGVTLAVSMLRGLSELGDGLASVTGRWWLTDAGRPVLATGLGTESVAEASRVVLDGVADALGDPGLIDAMGAAIDRAAVTARELALLEQRLFSVAAAEPLSDAPLVPQRTRTPEPITIAQARRPDDPLLSAPPSGLVDRLVRHVDADVADLVSRATTGIWRRLRTRSSTAPRGRVWALAAGAAVAVVMGGMLWPTDDGTVAAQPSPPATPVGSAPAAEAPAVDTTIGTPAAEPPRPDTPVNPDTSAGTPVGEDLAGVASALLTERAACADDTACLAGVLVEPTARFAAGAVDLAPSDRTTVVLDEFGGVAVLRVDAGDPAIASQLVVIQQEEDEWLLRDVYVAQQP
ncbi:hypothetical protein QL996_00325 [Planococcus sp. APC 4015]|nr:hypothetical protein [Planococcus sp. APC 4015]